MILGNQVVGNEAKSGMSSHQINWEEHRHADDRIFLAMIIQLLIKDIWEKHFTTDMEVKHGPELNPESNDANERARQEDQENHHEAPPEIEESPDPWEAEQEAAEWLGNVEQCRDA